MLTLPREKLNLWLLISMRLKLDKMIWPVSAKVNPKMRLTSPMMHPLENFTW